MVAEEEVISIIINININIEQKQKQEQKESEEQEQEQEKQQKQQEEQQQQKQQQQEEYDDDDEEEEEEEKEEVIISSSSIQLEKEKDRDFWERKEIEGLKICNVKKYIICNPPHNDDDNQLQMVGIVECHNYLEPYEDLSPDHGFIFFNSTTKFCFFSRLDNIDGTSTFAGYMFGEMKKFMTTGSTEEDYRKWLDAEVAKNPLDSASKV